MAAASCPAYEHERSKQHCRERQRDEGKATASGPRRSVVDLRAGELKGPHQVRQHENQKALDWGAPVDVVRHADGFAVSPPVIFLVDLLHVRPEFFECRQRIAIFETVQHVPQAGL
jgi:hypothetical protein